MSIFWNVKVLVRHPANRQMPNGRFKTKNYLRLLKSLKRTIELYKTVREKKTMN